MRDTLNTLIYRGATQVLRVGEFASAGQPVAPTPTPLIPTAGVTAPGGINFTDIAPSDGGIKSATIWKSIAQIVMYFGYGFTFLAFLTGIVVWGYGSAFLGRDTVEHAKKTILRASAGAILLGSAGAIWTWLITR